MLQTRIHPETGQTLVRGKRSIELRYKSQVELVEMEGWYAEDDPTGDSGIHVGSDCLPADEALARMKSRENAE